MIENKYGIYLRQKINQFFIQKQKKKQIRRVRVLCNACSPRLIIRHKFPFLFIAIK